jgi:RNA polymerase sigma-70 factor, ECF subfamily
MSAKLESALIRLKDGNLDGLREIYELTSKGVFTFVLPIVADYQLAEDIMQETYVKVNDRIASYIPDTNGRNWILTIAKNLALDELRKRKHEEAVDFDDERQTIGCYTLPDEMDTPTIKMANQILSPEELEIVMLFAIGEYKHREIAKMLDMPIGTVTWKYHNALEKLRKVIKK